MACKKNRSSDKMAQVRIPGAHPRGHSYFPNRNKDWDSMETASQVYKIRVPGAQHDTKSYFANRNTDWDSIKTNSKMPDASASASGSWEPDDESVGKETGESWPRP